MERTRARITYGLIGGTLCLAAWAATAAPRPAPNVVPTTNLPVPQVVHTPPQVQIPKAPPRIEVVFAVDTTGSMGGLIDGAKRKIWSLAQFIGSGQPKPDLRIGLVAYRDRGDQYVTKFYDLSDDLDEVFDHLQAFQADGGGDGPEDVNRALSDAIDRTSWTEGQNTLKIIYVVGDAPPHDDYTDEPNSRALARRAQERGIRINTVRCGSDTTTEVAFARIAHIASGEFATIDQTGGVHEVKTPYDEKLAALNKKLVGTAIGYGSGGAEVRRKVAASMAAPTAIAADRATFFGHKGGAVGGDGNLVDDVATGRVKAEDVPAASLPPEVAAMPAPARHAYVADKERERSEVQVEINRISSERNDYLKKSKPKDDKSFDGAVEGTLRKQAAESGLKL